MLHLPKTMRGLTLLLLLAIFVPILALQALLGVKAYRQHRTEEENETFEAARAAKALAVNYTADVGRQLGALGLLLGRGGVDANAAGDILAAQAKQHSGMLALLWAGAEGKVIAANTPQAKGGSVGEEECLRRALHAGPDKWVVSDLALSKKFGKPVFCIWRPVGDASSSKGVLLAVMDPQDLSRNLLQVPRGNRTSAVLFDREGRLLASAPAQVTAWEKMQPEAWRLTDAKAAADGEKLGRMVSPVDGSRSAVAQTPVPEMGWTAGSGVPVSHIYGPLYHEMAAGALANLAVVGVSLAGAMLISRRLSSNLGRLAHHVRHLATEGASRETLPPLKVRELDELGVEFQDMAVFRDRVQQDLRQARNRLNEILESISDGFVSLDQHQRFLYVNSAAKAILSLPQEDLIGRQIVEVFPEIAEFAEQYQAAVVDKRRFQFETYCKNLQTWFEVHCYPTAEGASVFFADVSERRRMQEALKTGEQRLQEALSLLKGIAESTPDLIAAQDHQLRYTFLNEAYRREFRAVFGSEVAVGVSILEALAGQPEVQRMAQELWNRALSGEAFKVTEHFNDPRGRAKVFELSYNPVRGPGGGIIGAALIARDITQHARTEEALRKARVRTERDRAQFEAVFQSMADGVVVCDAAGQLVMVNESAARTAGYANAAEMQRDMARLLEQLEISTLDGQAVPISEWPMSKVLRGESVTNWELRVKQKARGREWVFGFNGEPVRNDRGEQVLSVIVARDITERKRAEQALRRARDEAEKALAQQAAMLQSMTEGLVIVGPQGDLLDVNPAALRIYGFESVASLRGPLSQLTQMLEVRDLAGRVLPLEEWPISLALRGETFSGLEVEVRRKDGLRRWIASYGGAPVRDRYGNMLLAIVTMRDVTAEKIAERSLRENEARLRQVVEELGRSNHELEQFAYIASHDLQEPLRMVTMFLRLLQQRYQASLDEKAQEFIGYAVDGAERMSALIRDLLEYSRAGTVKKEMAPVEFGEVVRQAAENLAVTFKETGAELATGDLPVVIGDERQLTQLMQNLIANATKFRREGVRPAVRVSATRRGGWWEFVVADNGIGIQADQLERVFQVFQRLHTREKYPGTGIGLAICKKIVERHGGRIWVESRVGEGSQFHFTLRA